MIGETLGNYRIISSIGQGGMGVVYLAEHALIGRKAAVKLLRPDVSRDLVDRFFNEARAAAKLRHAGLVEVFDFGYTDEGAYIVMEFLDGESLAERLAREHRLGVPTAAMITRQVASALQVAHQEGIIHRDLKPENIFLVPDADSPAGVRPKVLDFGIAKLTHDQTPRSVKTNSGAVFGTPRYMSPEQCRNARTVDGRADVYSLGCLFYEMLLGVAPFDYDNWGELVGAHLHETPPRPTELDPTLPKDVEAVVLKMLEKRAEDRYPSMGELAQALEAVWRAHARDPLAVKLTPPAGVPINGTTARSRAVGVDPTLPAGSEAAIETSPIRRVGSRRWLLIAGAVALVAVGGVAAWQVLAKPPASAPEPEQAFIVVDQRSSQDVRGATRAQDPVAAQSIDAGVAAPEPPPDAAVRAQGSASTVRRTEPDTQQLARAFARQNGAIASCFRQHPDPTNTEIKVRFRIDVNGRVVKAEVLPAAVVGTPLGTCIVGAAQATAFGPQPKDLTFSVPLRVNVTGGS